ncbi:hypothetical protein HWD35_10380 [Tsukamurella tyrosinosolvens]|uniref:hypothetical protein n=1 Tax=Tsukamurella tyrosinosolvens TaxID=57704 RepID=UPI001CE13C15|nr:hypothetical protein [Tsukamurella tyrosinosolvens]MCA4995118.1 hypothetical protein [Tsukamurella tyrosinosolvens]
MAFSSDPERTQERVDQLRKYMTTNVDDGTNLVCGRQASCRASIDETTIDFHGGQLMHVGKHYDLSDGYIPWRVLVVGLDTGRDDEHVTLEVRYEQLVRSMNLTFSGRNPHMRGTTSALRLGLGLPLGGDKRGEFVKLTNEAEPVHVMDTYAMTNVRLCSAKLEDSTKSQGTKVMSRNCFPHLQKTIEILEPDLCIFQSKGARNELGALVKRRRPADGELEFVKIGSHETMLANFTHPSTPDGTHNWGVSAQTKYLLGTVEPTIAKARRYHFGR